MSDEPFPVRFGKMIGFWREVDNLAHMMFGKGCMMRCDPSTVQRALEILLTVTSEAEDCLDEVLAIIESNADTIEGALEVFCVGQILIQDNGIGVICSEIVALARDVVYAISEDPKTVFDDEM